MSTALIEQLSNDGTDTVIAHGTGFMWRHAGRVFVVTARHVVSGRDPFDDSPMSSLGFIPQRLRIYPSIENPTGSGQWTRVAATLDVGPDTGRPWLQDPEFDALRTDIAAIELPMGVAALVTPPTRNVMCLNDDASVLGGEIMSWVGSECAIVGYPQSRVGGAMTPIWRRGTFASEPLLPVDDKPMFLLDAATSPGFSGSPVFRRHMGPVPIQEADGSITIRADAVITTNFIGVYAGRLRHSHYGGEVPFVFYANRLPFVFAQLS